MPKNICCIWPNLKSIVSILSSHSSLLSLSLSLSLSLLSLENTIIETGCVIIYDSCYIRSIIYLSYHVAFFNEKKKKISFFLLIHSICIDSYIYKFQKSGKWILKPLLYVLLACFKIAVYDHSINILTMIKHFRFN